MDNPLTKRVSMIELFYDLVFAYMISQATELIHHLSHGLLAWQSLVTFVIVVIVFINSWMIQAVFTNRYGQSSWTDIVFYFINMMILLYMANSFSATSYRDMRIFFIAAGLLSLTLFLQYFLVWLKSKQTYDQQIAKVFCGILLFRTLVLLIGGLLNTPPGNFIAIAGVIIAWILPAFTGKVALHHPIIFSHLLERLTLLIIITFGETIIGIADYFTPQNFSIWSCLIFLIVASLFFAYITEFDHLIDGHRRGETGNLLIYLHYLILFGLSLITVALKFISEKEANANFAIACLYSGLFLFYAGLTLATRYNYQRFTQLLSSLILLAACCSLSLMNPSLPIIASLAAAATFANAAGKVSRLYHPAN
jgi:low temperature requirement protein LtrA